MNKNLTPQESVNTVCNFLEIKPITVSDNDTLDSLTHKISSETNTSKFSQKIENLSIDYAPLKLSNMLSAVMNGHSHDDALKSLYHIGIKRLDEILGSLTKEYCADNCTNGRFRCCGDVNTYKIGFSDNGVLRLQELESGIHEDYSDELSVPGCKYLNEITGCTLKISKSSVCMGYLCNSIKDYVKQVAPVNGIIFVDEMRNLSNSETVTIETINALDKAALFGKLAIEEKNSRI